MMQKLAGKDTDSTAGKSGSRPLQRAARQPAGGGRRSQSEAACREKNTAPAGTIHLGSSELQPSRRAAAEAALQRPRRRVAANEIRLCRRCPAEPQRRQALQRSA